METAIVKAVPQNIIRTMDDAERAARAMSASGFFPDSKQAAQAVVKILAGSELGFGPFASMTGVAIIQGKPAVGANLMAAALKRTGKYNYRIISLTDDGCELAFFEGGQEVGRSRFDKNDATAAGLLNKDNWKKYPRNMFFARALSNGVRWYTPDIYNGATVYTPDELDAVVDADGNAVEVVQSQAVEIKSTSIDPEAIYNEACNVVMKIQVKGEMKEVAIGNMNRDQLEWVINHAQVQKNADAAAIVLQHDFGTSAKEPEATAPAGQLL